MTWVALKSLAERRMRAALTALAIVLGVAMIAGSLILTDTIDRAFTNIFGSSYTQTDLVVRGDAVVDDAFAGTPTVPADLLPADPGRSPASPRPRRAAWSTSPAPATPPRSSTATARSSAATCRASASASTRRTRASTR